MLQIRQIEGLAGLGRSIIRFVDIPVRCGATGFPSAADDYLQNKLSLDEFLNLKADTTFFFKATGNSMIEMGIEDGDILIVDTRLNPLPGKICLCRFDNELICKKVEKKIDGVYLVSANILVKPIRLTEDSELLVFGVVIYTLKKV